MLRFVFNLSVIVAMHFTLLPAQYGISSCADYRIGFVHTYYPVRHCQKSNKTIISSSNVTTVEKCAEFASMRKAMAFNFAPSGRGRLNAFNKPKG